MDCLTPGHMISECWDPCLNPGTQRPALNHFAVLPPCGVQGLGFKSEAGGLMPTYWLVSLSKLPPLSGSVLVCVKWVKINTHLIGLLQD